LDGFAEKENLEGKGSQTPVGEYAPRGSHPRRMQQLREQDHAASGMFQMRVLQGKTDTETRGNSMTLRHGRS
jgi:hypothetical protein